MNDTSRQELIESRIDRDLAGSMPMSELGVVFRQMSEVMEFAKMMAVSGPAVPPVFRNNPGACLAVAIKAHHLGFEPFSFASKCYFVNDQLAYEAQLINAIIIKRGPFVKRPTVGYAGEGTKRQCIVTLHFAEPDGDMVYTSPEISGIKVQNSPLWKSDPDQQLAYYSVRAAARRYCPDVIMGMYDQDEMASIAAKDITPIGRPRADISAALTAGDKVAVTYVEAGKPVGASPAAETPPVAQTPTDTPDPSHGAPKPSGGPIQPDVLAEITAALAATTTKADVLVVADEFAGYLMTVPAEVKTRAELLMSARLEEME